MSAAGSAPRRPGSPPGRLPRGHTGGAVRPRHVAVIMDGNGRWARARGLPRAAGHRRGVEAVRALVNACGELGIPFLTVFAFSSENWHRPPSEVGLLMELFLSALEREIDRLHENGVRLRVLGVRERLDGRLVERIQAAEALTRDNGRLTLNIAVDYGARNDLVRACRELARRAAAGELEPQAIGPDTLAAHLASAGLPEPDLLIRTGGEQRLSNFLLWECAYAELYFTPVLWPDFDRAGLDEALAWFAGRERRFGRTGEQLAGGEAGAASSPPAAQPSRPGG